MTQDEKKMKALGEMVFGMITDVLIRGGTAYSRRKVTFPTSEDRATRGSVEIVITSDADLADLFEDAVGKKYQVEQAHDYPDKVQ